MRRLLPLALFLLACHGSPTEPDIANATLSGRVVFLENGSPAPDARVVAHLQPSVNDAEARTDSNGRYSFQNLQGGDYFVKAYPPGSSVLGALKRAAIVPGPNVLDLEISANSCAVMSGVIRDDDTRQGIAGATLSFFGATATSRSDGSYEISLGCPPRPTGTTYVLILEHPAYERREILSSVLTYSTTFDLLMHRR
jgi:hypothetical protein